MVDHSCKKLYYVLVDLYEELTLCILVKPSCLLAFRLPHITERSEGYDYAEGKRDALKPFRNVRDAARLECHTERAVAVVALNRQKI